MKFQIVSVRHCSFINFVLLQIPFLNKTQLDAGFSERLKINGLDMSVMLQCSSVFTMCHYCFV